MSAAPTFTVTYGRVHDGFLAVARAHRIAPIDVRLLVALEERGGVGRTDELEAETLTNATAIRRSSIALRAAGLILADAGAGTDATRRGTRSRLTLTDAGRLVARQALARIRDTSAAPAERAA